jgi:hypothetical protein
VLDRSAPQKHVWRANIILATADGCGTAEIMRRSSIAESRPRHQIPKRHRGHQNVGSPRRLIDHVTQSPA